MASSRYMVIGLLVGLGVIAAYVVTRPEAGKNLASAPTGSGKTQRATLLAVFNPVKNTIRLKELPGAPMSRLEKELFDGDGRGVPDRSSGYLYVMNAAAGRDLQDRQAHWKLSKAVAAVRLVSPASHGATFQKVPNLPRSVAGQYEMWVARDMDLLLEIDADIAEGLIPAA